MNSAGMTWDETLASKGQQVMREFDRNVLHFVSRGKNYSIYLTAYFENSDYRYVKQYEDREIEPTARFPLNRPSEYDGKQNLATYGLEVYTPTQRLIGCVSCKYDIFVTFDTDNTKSKSWSNLRYDLFCLIGP
ncbi:hypothetical protein B9Z55_027133 [Caenorhabditis nigoni]|uniref:Uncharacterized protein n=1 Tax=Caenorhabditis nigoni TaxID=1611254 RepID=A0A2G5SJI2_9PELO|nr:hypothetical protein B9Z55_027133 [Caenorhabditis nigoni]